MCLDYGSVEHGIEKDCPDATDCLCSSFDYYHIHSILQSLGTLRLASIIILKVSPRFLFKAKGISHKGGSQILPEEDNVFLLIR